MRLQGKTAVITGAAGGIGLAIGRRFAAEGAHVVLTDLQSDKVEAEAKALRDRGLAATALALDAAHETAIEAAIERIEREIGPVDIAVCSAGMALAKGVFYETDTADFEAVLRLNLVGPFLMGKAVARRMVAARRKGSIINISSVGGVLAVAESPAYCVSKAGLNMLTKAQALALAPHGVRVNGIGPGPTDSPMTEHLPEAARAKMLARTPLGRFGDVDEIAGVAVFLASEDAGYVTGQTIFADGGRLALNYTVDAKLN